jgi:hypothetical protein
VTQPSTAAASSEAQMLHSTSRDSTPSNGSKASATGSEAASSQFTDFKRLKLLTPVMPRLVLTMLPSPSSLSSCVVTGWRPRARLQQAAGVGMQHVAGHGFAREDEK